MYQFFDTPCRGCVMNQYNRIFFCYEKDINCIIIHLTSLKRKIVLAVKCIFDHHSVVGVKRYPHWVNCQGKCFALLFPLIFFIKAHNNM